MGILLKNVLRKFEKLSNSVTEKIFKGKREMFQIISFMGSNNRESDTTMSGIVITS